MNCKNCGAEIDASATVCEKCGQPTKEKPVSTFVEAIKTCFNKYATFEGRANRAEYWWWALFNLLIGILGVVPILGWIITIGLLIPSIAVAVRRLHDIGKSGFYYFLCFIPIVGAIILLILFLQPSQEGANQYGENPNA